jgi:hypothetical protein
MAFSASHCSMHFLLAIDRTWRALDNWAAGEDRWLISQARPRAMLLHLEAAPPKRLEWFLFAPSLWDGFRHPHHPIA